MAHPLVVNVFDTDEYDVYIGDASPRLGLACSKWANPFEIGSGDTREDVVGAYERRVLPDLVEEIAELRGKRLGCWCAPEPCHGDVLARYANGENITMLWRWRLADGRVRVDVSAGYAREGGRRDKAGKLVFGVVEFEELREHLEHDSMFEFEEWSSDVVLENLGHLLTRRAGDDDL